MSISKHLTYFILLKEWSTNAVSGTEIHLANFVCNYSLQNFMKINLQIVLRSEVYSRVASRCVFRSSCATSSLCSSSISVKLSMPHTKKDYLQYLLLVMRIKCSQICKIRENLAWHLESIKYISAKNARYAPLILFSYTIPFSHQVIHYLFSLLSSPFLGDTFRI